MLDCAAELRNVKTKGCMRIQNNRRRWNFCGPWDDEEGTPGWKKEAREKEQREWKEAHEKATAEAVRKEALRSGQWPERPRDRTCFHPEVLHILFNTSLSTGKTVSGMAY